MGLESPLPPKPAESSQKEKELEKREQAERFLRSEAWIPGDNIQIEDIAGEVRNTGSPLDDPDNPYIRKRMSWNRHGHALGAVGPDGKLYVTPWSKSKEEKLVSLGFEESSSLGVPLSGNEIPVDEEYKKQWQKGQSLTRMEKAVSEKE